VDDRTRTRVKQDFHDSHHEHRLILTVCAAVLEGRTRDHAPQRRAALLPELLCSPLLRVLPQVVMTAMLGQTRAREDGSSASPAGKV
jgi:hypothetical protein